MVTSSPIPPPYHASIYDNFQRPHLTPYSTLYNISDQAMQLVWDKTHVDFQREAIPRLLSVRCAPYNYQALFLVQGTCGGKSAAV